MSGDGGKAEKAGGIQKQSRIPGYGTVEEGIQGLERKYNEADAGSTLCWRFSKAS
jgi:hypothetical protein